MASINQNTGEIVTTPVPSVVQIPAVATPTASTVYSSDNIASAASGTPTVNPILDEYTQYMNSPELQAAKAKTAEIQGAINAEKAGLRSTTTGLEYQNQGALGTTGASMNLIGTQVGRASSLASDRISALGDQYTGALTYQQGLEQTAREKYSIIANERQNKLILSTQYPGAGISATDSYETINKKVTDYQKKLKDDDFKSSLKTLALQFGLKSSGSTKDLENRIKKYNKEALNTAKRNSELTYKTALEQYNQLVQKRTDALDLAGLFGDSNGNSGTVMTPQGGVSTNNASAYFNTL